MLEGLRTAIYIVDDFEAARDWYTRTLGFGPYFDEPFYVGFDVGGYELGLLPGESGAGVSVYWGVLEIRAAMGALISFGATQNEEIRDVGDGIKTASVRDPFGNILGIIENPHFRAPAAFER